MTKIRIFSLGFVFIIFLLLMNLAHADEEILFNNNKEAQEILLNHNWICDYKSGRGSGASEIDYKKVEMKRVSADYLDSNCSGGKGVFNGKFKKGRLKGRISNQPFPCASSTATNWKFFIKADGSYYKKARYSSATYRGEMYCDAIAKQKIASKKPQNESDIDFNSFNKTFTRAGKMKRADWMSQQELERTWQAALVRIPKGEGEFYSMRMDKLNEEAINQGRKFPTIIFLHGCLGFRDSTYRRTDFPAKHGYVVIAPNSFAREKYTESCNFSTNPPKTGMYRDVTYLRQADAAYTIEKAKKLPWVDPDNIFLMGHSEGGIITATLHSKTSTVNARIIEGWTCRTPWMESNGIKAPKSEPVLALVGSRDPALQNNPLTQGKCSVNKRNGSKSIVYKDGYLSKQHDLIGSPEVQNTILEFLRSNSK